MLSLKELVHSNYPQVPSHKPVIDACKLMHNKDLGAVLISDGLKIVGIFSERDLMNRVVTQCRDPLKLPIGEVMTTNLITVPLETRPTVAIELMHRKKIRHLPVTENSKVIGVINMRILLSHIIRNLAEINRDLQTELDQLRFFGMKDEKSLAA